LCAGRRDRGSFIEFPPFTSRLAHPGAGLQPTGRPWLGSAYDLILSRLSLDRYRSDSAATRGLGLFLGLGCANPEQG
tara:strand:+ start:3469 stop:3699 length:231 start_codon:yes stop_codon:yes gene_type:complete